MPNERLRGSIAGAGLTVERLAEIVGVDPKTVERWVSKDRIPRRAHRSATATILKADELYLWPALLDDVREKSASLAEFVALYPHRGAVPLHLWSSLLDQARDCIDILIYAGLFFMDGTPDIAKTLIRAGESGVRVRLVLGDPDSEAVALRGAEEGVFGGVAARVRLSLTHLQDAIGAPGVEIRLQSATLYNSVFRFDETLLVNTHAYGAPASQSPVIHVQRVPGGRLFDHYLSSFDKVWSRSVPASEKGTA
ncbi:XRE family transcriptional regulator [Frankia sp. Hr75.2]|nr:XRE family transcriptional regulator [Frankia sp. Hr75.2]